MSNIRKMKRDSNPDKTKKSNQVPIPAPIYDRKATRGNIFAFPSEIRVPGTGGGHTTKTVPGMSLLDYFAGRIFCRQSWPIRMLPAKYRARLAYGQAAELAAQRQRFIN